MLFFVRKSAAFKVMLFLLVAISTGSTNSVGADDQRPPNFVLIFTDDQGYNDVGCFGSPLIRTPNLDRMAAEGTRFTDFYVSSAVCSASRSALMTGSYNTRVNINGALFPNRGKIGLNPNEITVAEVLKQKDYATACIGKWHLGDEKPFLPTRQGFDYYFGIPYSNDMTVNPTMDVADDIVWREGMDLATMRQFDKRKKNWVPLLRNEKVAEYPADQTTLTKRYTEEAIGFIEKHKAEPFFVYLPHTLPHIPLFVSKEFENHNEERGLYGSVIEEIDWSVGEILKTLEQHELSDNTVVVFTTDNGPWLSFGKRGGSADPLRDGKFSNYEGGMRVPTIAWGPGRVAAGKTCREVAATIDILPTFADFAGAKTPTDRVIDGSSLVPLLTGEKDARSPHDAYFYDTRAVRQGKWKLMLSARSTLKKQPPGPMPALYDLEADISETTNVAEDHPEIVQQLKTLIEQHRADLKKNSRPRGQLKNE